MGNHAASQGIGMRWFFFLLFVIEVWLVITIAGAIGTGWTILWLIGDIAIGSALIRHGAIGLLLYPDKVLQGDEPARILLDAPLMALAGLLFILPGFLSDVLGLLLLLPWLRRLLARRWVTRMVPPDADGVIEGEYIVIRRSSPGAGDAHRLE